MNARRQLQWLFVTLMMLTFAGAWKARAARLINVPAGGNFQAALSSVQPGETVTIVLQSGATYSTTTSFVIPSGVTVQSSASLPAGRLNPATHGARLAKVISSGGYPVIQTAAGAHDIVIAGIEITTNGRRYTPDLVQIGFEATTREQGLAQRNIIIERCFVHPFEVTTANLSPSVVERTAGRGIGVAGIEVTIRHNWIGGFAGKYPANDSNAGQNIDSYGIYSPTGPGPLRILNNYIDAQFNNIFLGGADAGSTNVATISGATITSAVFSNTSRLVIGDLVAMQSVTTPKPWQTGRVTAINGNTVSFTLLRGQFASATVAPMNRGKAQWNGDLIHDIEIRGNTLNKPDAWNAFSNPKAWIEIKACAGCVIDGNDMYSGVGTTNAFTSRNQNGSAPWTTIRNVVFTNNRMVGFKWGFSIQTLDNEQPNTVGGNFTIANNLFYRPLQVDQIPQFLQIYDGNNVTVTHNTVITNGAALFSGNGNVVNSLVLKDNIIATGPYGFSCFNSGPCWPGLVLQKNGILDTRNDQSPALSSVYPGNYYPANISAVRFVDPGNGNYRLTAGSPLRGRASDGKDVGVDVDALLLALK